MNTLLPSLNSSTTNQFHFIADGRNTWKYKYSRLMTALATKKVQSKPTKERARENKRDAESPFSL